MNKEQGTEEQSSDKPDQLHLFACSINVWSSSRFPETTGLVQSMNKKAHPERWALYTIIGLE